MSFSAAAMRNSRPGQVQMSRSCGDCGNGSLGGSTPRIGSAAADLRRRPVWCVSGSRSRAMCD